MPAGASFTSDWDGDFRQQECHLGTSEQVGNLLFGDKQKRRSEPRFGQNQEVVFGEGICASWRMCAHALATQLFHTRCSFAWIVGFSYRSALPLEGQNWRSRLKLSMFSLFLRLSKDPDPWTNTTKRPFRGSFFKVHGYNWLARPCPKSAIEGCLD